MNAAEGKRHNRVNNKQNRIRQLSQQHGYITSTSEEASVASTAAYVAHKGER